VDPVQHRGGDIHSAAIGARQAALTVKYENYEIRKNMLWTICNAFLSANDQQTAFLLALDRSRVDRGLSLSDTPLIAIILNAIYALLDHQTSEKQNQGD